MLKRKGLRFFDSHKCVEPGINVTSHMPWFPPTPSRNLSSLTRHHNAELTTSLEVQEYYLEPKIHVLVDAPMFTSARNRSIYIETEKMMVRQMTILMQQLITLKVKVTITKPNLAREIQKGLYFHQYITFHPKFNTRMRWVLSIIYFLIIINSFLHCFNKGHAAFFREQVLPFFALTLLDKYCSALNI